MYHSGNMNRHVSEASVNSLHECDVVGIMVDDPLFMYRDELPRVLRLRQQRRQ